MFPKYISAWPIRLSVASNLAFFFYVDFTVCFTSSLNSANPCIHVYLLLLFYRSFTWQFIMECLLLHIRHFSQLLCLFYVIFYRTDLSFLLSFIHILSIFTHTCVSVLSCFSRVWLFVTVALQAPLSKGFSRQECWSGLPCLPPGYLPDRGLLHCKQILYCLSHQGNPSYIDGCIIIFQYCYFHLSFMNGL